MSFASMGAAPRIQKRKTYGKRPDTNHQAFAHFADTPQKPKATPSTWSPSPSPEPATVVSPSGKPATGKLKRPSPRRPREVDMFDFPGSDAERLEGPRPQKRAVSSTVQIMSHRKQMAASDVKAHREPSTIGKRKRDEDAAEAQLLQETALYQHSTESPDLLKQLSKSKAETQKAPANPTAKSTSGPRPLPATSKVTAVKERHSEVDRSAISKSAASRVAPKLASPPILIEAAYTDSEDTDGSAYDKEPAFNKRQRSSSNSDPRTPSHKSASPASIASLARSGSVTPRQNELWSKLLGRVDGTNSPFRLAVDQLRISSSSKASASRLMTHAAPASTAPVQMRRGRLIDTLEKRPGRASTEGDTDEDESMADDTSELESVSEDQAALGPSEAEIAAASRSQGPSKVTYGQVRSYMEDSGLEAELMLDSPVVPIKQVSKHGHGSQQQLSHSTLGQSQDDGDDEDSQHPMKSVHELRAKGESRRFVDDFENLLDDIQHRNSASWSRQRSSVIELCEKLMDRSFVGRMVDAGLDERLLVASSDASDPIFNFVVAANLALIGSAEVSLTVLRHIQQSECFDMLFKLLLQETDVKVLSKDRKSNMSKIAQGSFAEFCAKLRSSSLFAGDKSSVLSPQLVSLQAIEVVVRRMRRLGHMDDLLDEQKTSDLLQVLERRVAAQQEPGKAEDRNLEYALSTLEAGSVIPGRIQSAWTPRRMDRLAKVLPNILDPAASNAAVLSPLALRLMLNLTNGKATASTAFATPRLVQLLVSAINEHFARLVAHVKPSSEEETNIDDRLILSLGAMINLAEFSDLARTSVIGEHQQLLHGLVDTFLENRGKAAEADSLALTASNVAYGYLAVLLGNLCENEQVKREVAARLPDGSLTALIEAIEEFVAYNKVADRSAYESDEGGNVWRVFTERLASVAEKLKQ